jgi:hypothetical protein
MDSEELLDHRYVYSVKDPFEANYSGIGTNNL